MKKLVIFIAIFTMAITFIIGCNSNREQVTKEYVDMHKLSSNVWYDGNTCVMYYVVNVFNAFGITPILNADGTPKIYHK